jgi:HAE1 family hydrophobic/amphiphilic exporter-1
MTSTSSLGSTAITIQFDLNRNIDGAANDVSGRHQRRQRPIAQEPAEPADLSQGQSGRLADPAAVGDVGHAADDQVDDAVDDQLAQQISQISGVAQVTSAASRSPSIRVQIDPAKLVAKGLSLEDVRPALNITRRQSQGQYRRRTRAYTIYANDQLLDAKDWNDVIVAYRNGGPLRVRDIGKACRPEDAKQAAWANGKRGVFLVVFKQPGANVIDTVDKIKRCCRGWWARSRRRSRSVISDRTQTIRAAVKDVQFTLLLTIALVVMVIFVFLRSFWATIIPSVTVPLALLGACALMWVFGYSLDNLSLMALTIAVGFVVDDAIVMLENITRYIEEGEKPMEAAFKGASEIGFTIISISISLIAVLIPLLLMGGIIGRLFREFAVTLR